MRSEWKVEGKRKTENEIRGVCKKRLGVIGRGGENENEG